MRVFPSLLAVIFVAASLPGCANVTVLRYETVSRQPKPFGFPISILDKAKIDRPYKVIGLVQIDANKEEFAAEIIEQIKHEARRLGGDALMDLHQEPVENRFSFGSGYPIYQHDLFYTGHFRDLWTAKVIVWQNQNP